MGYQHLFLVQYRVCVYSHIFFNSPSISPVLQIQTCLLPASSCSTASLLSLPSCSTKPYTLSAPCRSPTHSIHSGSHPSLPSRRSELCFPTVISSYTHPTYVYSTFSTDKLTLSTCALPISSYLTKISL